MYQKAISNFKIDTESMPISAIKRETLLKAKEILLQIKDIIEKDFVRGWFRKDDEEFAEKQKQAEIIGELSSKYYELIPLKENERNAAAPINHINRIRQQSELLETLLNVEFSSRILLGALYRQY